MRTALCRKRLPLAALCKRFCAVATAHIILQKRAIVNGIANLPVVLHKCFEFSPNRQNLNADSNAVLRPKRFGSGAVLIFELSVKVGNVGKAYASGNFRNIVG